MATSNQARPPQPESAEKTLQLLNFIESNENLTQRTLAVRMEVALGLINALLKRAVRKGLVKVQNAPARRYAYYLTPKGFQEKSRLTAEYLSSSLDFFRRVRLEYAEAFDYCAIRGWQRVALYGTGELAEIAILAADNINCDVVAIIDGSTNRETFAGVPVFRDLDEIADGVDAIVITDQANPQLSYEKLRGVYPELRCLTPNLLHVSRKNGNPSPHQAR